MTPTRHAGTALLVVSLSLLAPLASAQTPVEDQADHRLVTQMGKALTNDAPSQYELALMYETGIGTPRDLRLAHLWYTKSAKQGYEPAVKRLATWDADIERVEREEREKAEQEERARQQAEAARQTRERAAQEAKARQQAEAEARAAREASRARQQAEAAAKAASERAARQEAAKPRPAAARPAEPAASASPVAAPAAAKAATEPAPASAPVAEKSEKEEAEKAGFSANPCKGPSAKFLSTCR